MEQFLTDLTSPQLFAQLPAIAVALFVALLAGRAARRAWQAGAPTQWPWQTALIEGLVRLAPGLAAVILLAVVRALYAGAAFTTDAIDLVLKLATVLVLIRDR